MTVGIGPDGVTVKTLTEIIEELKVAMKAIYGEDYNVDESSTNGQHDGVLAQGYVELWDVLLELYNQLDPAIASNIFLDTVNDGVRGVPRLKKTNSKVTVQLTGVASTSISALTSKVSASTIPGVQFILIGTVVLDGAGEGTGVFLADTEGAIEIPINAIDTIDTPQAGWTGVDNSSAGVKGREVEADFNYRRRADESLGGRSQSMPASLKAALKALNGVTKVRVYDNRTGAPDANGVPGHSIATYVRGGIAQEIWDVMGEKLAYGPGLEGSQTGKFVDEEGDQHDMSYYVPADIDIELQVTVQESTGWTLSRVLDIQNICASRITEDTTALTADQLTGLCDLKLGYEIADDNDIRGSDFYGVLATLRGFNVTTVKVRDKAVGLPWIDLVALPWDKYPTTVLDGSDVTVIHAP